MKQTRDLMGMPITIVIEDKRANNKLFEDIFAYFSSVDERFSTYKRSSEISRINRGELLSTEYSPAMQEVLYLSEQTKQETDGYFDIWYKGRCDPSGLVKGWAIQNAAHILKAAGCKTYFINAGGDIQAVGREWKVGLRNPFNGNEVIKIVTIKDCGIATSGTYERGTHIYNPHIVKKLVSGIMSITVISKNIFDADRFATAAFAMGEQGVHFLEKHRGYEGYSIDAKGIATMTSGFENYVTVHNK